VNAIWQLASAAHDDAIVAMFMALNAEDPGPAPAEPQQMRVTLDRLRIEPYRGRAAVCEMNGRVVGYSLLIAFWSNELGGEICTIDELYVSPEYRSRGLATALFTELLERDSRLWNASPAALALEVSPHNDRARALYERLGFVGRNVAMRRRVTGPATSP